MSRFVITTISLLALLPATVLAQEPTSEPTEAPEPGTDMPESVLADEIVHPVVYWEISTPAYAETTAFYTELFGWEGVVDEEDGMTMTQFNSVMAFRDGQFGIMGAVMQATETIPPFQTIYVWTDNLDATLALVAENGGTVVFPPTEIAPGMTISHFVDPQGIQMGLVTMTEAEELPPGATPFPVVHWEIGSPDVASLVVFYSNVFGWAMEPVEAGYTLAGSATEAGPGIAGGFAQIEPELEMEPFLTWYVGTADLQGSYDQALALGATSVMPPTDVMAGIRVAMFVDPTGHLLGLFSLADFQ